MLTVDGYIRVSRVKERSLLRFQSPTTQREQIASWSRATGADVSAYFEDLDESGARTDRPGLEAVVRRVENHVTHGFVVWKVDRFFRSSLDGQLAIQRIMAANGTLFSVLDGLDSRTDTGRHMLRIMLSTAELEMDRVRDNWDRVHSKAVARGVYCAPAPIGYRRTRAGRLRPHPATGPAVTELFARRAEGASLKQLAVWLMEQGVLTSFGNVGWTTSTVWRVLHNSVYLGDVKRAPYQRENAHLALTDPATWQRAQEPQQPLYRRAVEPALLAGLVRCANCCSMCTSHWRRQLGYEKSLYMCRGHSAAGTCPRRGSMREARLDPYVIEAVFELLRKRRRPAVKRLRDAEEALARAQTDLAAYRDSMRLQAVLEEDTFLAGLRRRSEAVRDARIALAAERSRHAVHDLPRAAELRRDWPSMDLAERRVLIGRVIDCVVVAPGRWAPIDERVTICPAGTAPARLPYAGNRNALLQPFPGPLKRPRRQPGSLRPAPDGTAKRR